ncbi:MAG TPA: translation elongation factor Ts [Candidatus Bathyarchaeia archaeon]|nr:translation elongation factor Ts [Candidatus Bathyarchaeia archaeon]
MSKIDPKLIQKIREHTGLGMLDCRKALEEAGGDFEGAIELLRRKGAITAAKRSDKTTGEGLVATYIHPGDKLGVMVEINCETDFVAHTEDLKKFAKDLCLHIAAMKPLYVNQAEVDPKFLEHEKSILREQLADSGKPDKIINQILEGKLFKLYGEVCLLNQPFVKNDQQTIDDVIKELIGKTGENIVIKRFARYELGA